MDLWKSPNLWVDYNIVSCRSPLCLSIGAPGAHTLDCLLQLLHSVASCRVEEK